MDKVNVIVCALYVTETGTKHFDIKHTQAQVPKCLAGVWKH